MVLSPIFDLRFFWTDIKGKQSKVASCFQFSNQLVNTWAIFGSPTNIITPLTPGEADQFVIKSIILASTSGIISPWSPGGEPIFVTAW